MKNKKGAIELSASTIVILVIAIVVLGLALMFISGGFEVNEFDCSSIDKNNISIYEALSLYDFENCDCHFNETHSITGLYYEGELIRNNSFDENLPYGDVSCKELENE